MSSFKCEICTVTFNSADTLKQHVKSTHNLTCFDCWKVCTNSQELNHHLSQCLTERKGKRMETSLLLDETSEKSDKLIESKTKLKEQLFQSHEVSDKYKQELVELQIKLDDSKEQLKKKENEMNELVTKLKIVEHEKDVFKLDMEKKDLENLNLKNDIKALKRDNENKDSNDIITEKNEEIERGKLIIQEKEKSIKKMNVLGKIIYRICAITCQKSEQEVAVYARKISYRK